MEKIFISNLIPKEQKNYTKRSHLNIVSLLKNQKHSEHPKNKKRSMQSQKEQSYKF